MKKESYSLRSFRLPPDQLEYLLTLENASQFVREAIEEKRVKEAPKTKEEKIVLLTGQIGLKQKKLSKLENSEEYLRALENVEANEEILLYDKTIELLDIIAKTPYLYLKNSFDAVGNCLKKLDYSHSKGSISFQKIEKPEINAENKPITTTFYKWNFKIPFSDIRKRGYSECSVEMREADYQKEVSPKPEKIEEFFIPIKRSIVDKKAKRLAGLDMATNRKIIEAYEGVKNHIQKEIEELQREILNV